MFDTLINEATVLKNCKTAEDIEKFYTDRDVYVQYILNEYNKIMGQTNTMLVLLPDGIFDIEKKVYVLRPNEAYDNFNFSFCEAFYDAILDVLRYNFLKERYYFTINSLNKNLRKDSKFQVIVNSSSIHDFSKGSIDLVDDWRISFDKSLLGDDLEVLEEKRRLFLEEVIKYEVMISKKKIENLEDFIKDAFSEEDQKDPYQVKLVLNSVIYFLQNKTSIEELEKMKDKYEYFSYIERFSGFNEIREYVSNFYFKAYDEENITLMPVVVSDVYTNMEVGIEWLKELINKEKDEKRKAFMVETLKDDIEELKRLKEILGDDKEYVFEHKMASYVHFVMKDNDIKLMDKAISEEVKKYLGRDDITVVPQFELSCSNYDNLF